MLLFPASRGPLFPGIRPAEYRAIYRTLLQERGLIVNRY